MSYQFTISDMGMRLIKAYEGFQPRPRDLITGERVVGYGHRVIDDGIEMIDEDAAEVVLKNDLAHIEDFINTHVHAVLSQSQFDALCSLVFSIGEEAFLTSDIYHALNQGQVIEAANGFDVWRLSQIAGETYVVDALVRRRTAEKALFLRPVSKIARAPRLQLNVSADPEVSPETFSSWSRERAAAKLVKSTPVFADTVTAEADETIAVSPSEEPLDLETKASPIAEAAAEVSGRLDALMDQGAAEDAEADWPETLIESKDETYDEDNVLEFKPASELVEGVDYNRPSNDNPLDEDEAEETSLPYISMTLAGLIMAVLGILVSQTSTERFGQYGPLLTFSAIFIGTLLLIAGAYYWYRHSQYDE